MLSTMENPASSSLEDTQEIKIPKRRGWVKTILFGERFTCKGCFIRLIHYFAFSYIVITGLIIALIIYVYQEMENPPDYPEESEPIVEEQPIPKVDLIKIKAEIETETETIRELSLENEINYRILSETDYNAELEREYEEDDIDPEDDYQIEFEMLGFLKPGQDFSQMYADYVVGNVIGYYDIDTNQITMGETLSNDPLDLMVFSHEFTHALQDQTLHVFDDDLWDGDYCALYPDACEAYDALIEGDASLTGEKWYDGKVDWYERFFYHLFYDLYLINPKLVDWMIDYNTTFLDRDFEFPYIQGSRFVKHLYQSGGWEKVNAAYENPPESTEQILHPSRYPDDHPMVVYTPDFRSILNADWEVVDQAALGEWWLYLLFQYGVDESYQLPQHLAKNATAGWGGDSLSIFHNPATQERVLLYRSRWDTLSDSMEFGRVFSIYGTLRWGEPTLNQRYKIEWKNAEEGYIQLLILNDEVVWVMAPTREMVEKIITALPEFGKN